MMINNVFHFEIFPVNDSQHSKEKQAIQPGPIFLLGSDLTSAESLAAEESVSARGRVRAEFATSMKETLLTECAISMVEPLFEDSGDSWNSTSMREPLLTDCATSMREPLFADSGDPYGTVFPVSEGTRPGLLAVLSLLVCKNVFRSSLRFSTVSFSVDKVI